MPILTCVFNDEDENCDDPLPFDARSVTYIATAYVTGFENEFGYMGACPCNGGPTRVY